MVENQELGRGSFFGGLGGNIPPNTYSAALARGLPSKGELIHEYYNGIIIAHIELTIHTRLEVYFFTSKK